LKQIQQIRVKVCTFRDSNSFSSSRLDASPSQGYSKCFFCFCDVFLLLIYTFWRKATIWSNLELLHNLLRNSVTELWKPFSSWVFVLACKQSFKKRTSIRSLLPGGSSFPTASVKRRFLKLGYFRWPEVFRIFPKMTWRLPKVSKGKPKSF